jgi:hypothetical protein
MADYDRSIRAASGGRGRQLTVINAADCDRRLEMMLYAERAMTDAGAHAATLTVYRTMTFGDMISDWCDQLDADVAQRISQVFYDRYDRFEARPYDGPAIMLGAHRIHLLPNRELHRLLYFIKQVTVIAELPVWTVATVTDFSRFAGRAYALYPDASMMWESFDADVLSPAVV